MLEQPGGGATIAPANAGTVTDERGRFRLTGVPPGTVTLSFGAGEHHPRLVSGLTVVEGQELAGVTVELAPLRDGETAQLELVGIGVKLRPGEAGLLVDGVIEGGGAAAAGLQVGDELVSIDGALVEELGFDGAIAKIRGVEGTRVRVGFSRGGVVAEVLVERRKLRA
jgi:S1-C subfamily serine protease